MFTIYFSRILEKFQNISGYFREFREVFFFGGCRGCQRRFRGVKRASGVFV